MISSICFGCYSQRKVKNSESKSQQVVRILTKKGCCYSQRKVKNSESKSQRCFAWIVWLLCCYSQRKVKNSESKSQQKWLYTYLIKGKT